MNISVVIPVKNEAVNVGPLLEEIRSALDGLAAYEVIFIDDGSDDGTGSEVLRLAAGLRQLRLLRHARSCGQSAAILTGVRAARGDWVVTLDGDGQNDPADIPGFWRLACSTPNAPPLMVVGHRRNRQDGWSKRAASKIANFWRGRLLGDATPDTGCGLKLFPRTLFLDLPQFDHMHRFLPALALRAGAVVRSVPVNHRPRRRGVSKYGVFDRLGVGIVDLLGVMWLQRRAMSPTVLEEVPLPARPAEEPAEAALAR
jgi:dolichol-phosphate mannosyltransferase